MRIAIIGTRGIPNDYGGFEQFAEYLSVGLVEKGHDVTVYSPHFHTYKKVAYKGVHIKHIYSPENWMGSSIGSFFYDFSCMKDALRKEQFDIIYETGYTSIVPAYVWLNVRKIKSPVIITNMDGLEYKRTKFSQPVRRFLEWEEKMAVKYSPYLVTDNMAIHDYHKDKYNRESEFLAYGANVYNSYDANFLKTMNLTAGEYLLCVARLEPENNIETIIQGFLDSSIEYKPLVIVGKTTTSYGKYLLKEYGSYLQLKFVEGIYDFEKLNALRHYSYVYFHGHSVGGTNPSLLEAMASGCFVIANDNEFNRSVLNKNALYFKDKDDLVKILNNIEENLVEKKEEFIVDNLKVAETDYSWPKLIDDYEKYFLKLLK